MSNNWLKIAGLGQHWIIFSTSGWKAWDHMRLTARRDAWVQENTDHPDLTAKVVNHWNGLRKYFPGQIKYLSADFRDLCGWAKQKGAEQHLIIHVRVLFEHSCVCLPPLQTDMLFTEASDLTSSKFWGCTDNLQVKHLLAVSPSLATPCYVPARSFVFWFPLHCFSPSPEDWIPPAFFLQREQLSWDYPGLPSTSVSPAELDRGEASYRSC